MQLSHVYIICPFMLEIKYFLHIQKIKRKNELFQLSIWFYASKLVFLRLLKKKKSLNKPWISIPIAQHELLLNSSQSDRMDTLHLSVQQCNNPDQWFQQMQRKWWQDIAPAAAYTSYCLPSPTKLLEAALRWSDVLPSCTGLGQGGSTITAGCWLFNPQDKHASCITSLGNTELDITHY